MELILLQEKTWNTATVFDSIWYLLGFEKQISGLGSRYPGQGILTPTPDSKPNMWEKYFFFKPMELIISQWYHERMQQFDIIVVFIELLKTNNWVGVKIRWLGYLDPHPWFQAKYVKKIFFIQTNRINSVTRITWNTATVFDSIWYLLGV